MAAPVEVAFKLDIGQGDAMEKLLGQLTALSKQFDGAVKFKVGVGGGGPGVGQPGARGTNAAIGRLIRGVPGGGIAMAFKSLGMIGGFVTVALGAMAILKKIFSNSKILGTISTTFFKAAGAMVDIMLMPLVPLMLKALTWFIQKGFPIASNMGKRLAEIAEAVIKMVSGIKNIFKGILGGDFGQVWQGLKQLLGGYWELLKKVPSSILLMLGMGLPLLITKMVPVIWGAVKSAFNLGKSFFGGLGGWIWDGLNTAFNAYKSVFTTVGSWIGDGLQSLSQLWVDIGKLIGDGIWRFLDSIPGLGRLIPSPSKISAPDNILTPKGNGGGLFATPRPVSGGGGRGGVVETAIGGARNVVFNAMFPGLTLPIEITDALSDTLLGFLSEETELEEASTIAIRGP